MTPQRIMKIGLYIACVLIAIAGLGVVALIWLSV